MALKWASPPSIIGHESRDQDNWLATAELGISPGSSTKHGACLRGMQAKPKSTIDHFSVVTPPAANRGLPATSAIGREDDSLIRTAQRLYQQLDIEVTDVIQKRTARRAGRIFHGLLELLFIALPAVLLWRLAKDFFYEHLWMGSTQPLYGFDFLAQSALWVLVWGLVLRGVLTWRLQRGLNRDLAKIVQQLTPDVALGPLFDEYSTPARAVRERIARFSKIAADTDRLSHELEASGVSQLGRLHSIPARSSRSASGQRAFSLTTVAIERKGCASILAAKREVDAERLAIAETSERNRELLRLLRVPSLLFPGSQQSKQCHFIRAQASLGRSVLGALFLQGLRGTVSR